jgi:hypothetical protein
MSTFRIEITAITIAADDTAPDQNDLAALGRELSAIGGPGASKDQLAALAADWISELNFSLRSALEKSALAASAARDAMRKIP